MRDNGPVRDIEHRFPDDPSAKIISITDPEGIIQSVNETFVQVSGYTEEELIGQPQNIVRHPDMPSAVFKAVWETIQSGRPFMGIIKNRCKDGGYYWVNATIMPIICDGRITGYESVRTPATPGQIRRAERTYKKMREGKKADGTDFSPFTFGIWFVFFAALVYMFVGRDLISQIVFAVAAMLLVMHQYYAHARFLRRIRRMFKNHDAGRVNRSIYTSYKGEEGALIYDLLFNLKEVDTIMTRVHERSDTLSEIAAQNIAAMRNNNEEAQSNNEEVRQLAEEMQTIASNINAMFSDITSSANTMARSSTQAASMVSDGKRVADDTMGVIEHLMESANEVSSAINDLAKRVDDIENAAEMIQGIAAQTNLLALNASIEAARAGTHGRGFAVVADEVRALSLRTEEMTVRIQNLIAGFKKTTANTEELSETGRQNAESGVESVRQTTEKLDQILTAIREISGMSDNVAQSVSEHAGTAQDVTIKIQHITSMTEHGTDNTARSLTDLQNLVAISSDLHEMMMRYSNKDNA